MRVIIAGGRNFDNFPLLREVCTKEFGNMSIEIVSGGAPGADHLGELFALEMGYSVTKFPADWKKYGAKAGPIRNREMAEYAQTLIAFWDGKSRGTKNMIDIAQKKNLHVIIVGY
jgi:hypothetical protein